MTTREADIQAAIMLRVGALPGVRVFRNTVGEGWQGTRVERPTPDMLADRSLVVLKRPRYVRFGLHPGSPDLVGWRTVTITADMVGSVVGQFVGIEVKQNGAKPSTEQARFLAAITGAGGFANYWHDPASVESALMTGAGFFSNPPT